MNVEEARAIWDRVRVQDEGYLDAQARLERDGKALTKRQRLAADVLFSDFIRELDRVAVLTKGN